MINQCQDFNKAEYHGNPVRMKIPMKITKSKHACHSVILNEVKILKKTYYILEYMIQE